jgi:hypothetical protein
VTEDRDGQSIKGAQWKQHPEIALDEARRLADAEDERRRGADQNASTYLAVVAALVPLILAVATAIWDGKAGTAPTSVNMLFLALAVIYVAAAGFWAFRVLEVSVANRVGASDLVTAWRRPRPLAALIRDILWAARLNQGKVNQKVSGIKMAHAFLLRAFLTFSALLLFNIAWFLAQQALSSIPEAQARSEGANAWLATPATREHAIAVVEDLQRQLEASNSATAILDLWCTVHGMAPSGAVVAEKLSDGTRTAPLTVRELLRIGPNEPLGFRHVRLRCREHLLSEAMLWYVPSRLPPSINLQLGQSNMPFGRAVAPLGIRRQN